MVITPMKDKIKSQLREKKILNNIEASKEINMSRVYFTNIINGKAQSLKGALRVSHYLGGKLEDYFKIDFEGE
ncbi:hypothetical protein AWC37_04230 [Staphylococcus xylosus]|uniref:hypothetical protein n=1 Tax=Staphylococcus xylosus TaxID=1288 RepID=UPI0009BEE99D|nr:hypothetical protein [Staphylococcus xylosus]ARD74372.1 hypothetical protein AWC37_04230 [Staphylococcus xylosus]